jgi:hypothetical protein
MLLEAAGTARSELVERLRQRHQPVQVDREGLERRLRHRHRPTLDDPAIRERLRYLEDRLFRESLERRAHRLILGVPDCQSARSEELRRPHSNPQARSLPWSPQSLA